MSFDKDITRFANEEAAKKVHKAMVHLHSLHLHQYQLLRKEEDKEAFPLKLTLAAALFADAELSPPASAPAALPAAAVAVAPDAITAALPAAAVAHPAEPCSWTSCTAHCLEPVEARMEAHRDDGIPMFRKDFADCGHAHQRRRLHGLHERLVAQFEAEGHEMSEVSKVTLAAPLFFLFSPFVYF